MSKTLVIAEKPSMGREIAKVLGAQNWSNNAASGNGYVVTYAIGHLVELCEPEQYDKSWISWDKRLLPMIPKKFMYRVSEGTKDQFQIVRDLLLCDDFTDVVNACDAGREGELIFRLIYEMSGATLPVKRLWISSLTAEAIEEGFANLKPGSDYDGLLKAAKLRQISDWLIGLNATRAQTSVARETGSQSSVYSLGRVQTPTLSLVVFRDRDIDNFVAKSFYEVKAEFETPAKEKFAARLFDASSRHIKKLASEDEAKKLVSNLKSSGRNAQIASLSEKQVKTNSPLLFDLTLLQRTANEKFGLTAAKTLEIAQSLYEKKLLTYPRTSSCYLSDDVARDAVNILNCFDGSDYAQFADEIKSKEYVINPKKVNNAKVSDHHAIIPTGTRPDTNLGEHEKNIYDLVVRRFLAAFYPAAEDKRVDVIVSCAGAYFAAKGTTQISVGWRAVEREVKPESDADDDQAALPALEKDMSLSAADFELISKKTTPPKRFTEATLLQAMETAGKYIADEELRDAMKAGGLGTPATRASIIEGLIKREYLSREKKTLRSTPRAREVVTRLEKCQSSLASAILTGEWEHALSRIERGDYSSDEFRSSVDKLTRQTVSEILSQSQLADNNFAALEGSMSCPACALAGRKGFLIDRTKDGRNFSFCSSGREVCSYITNTPTKSKFRAKLSSEKCPKCASALVFAVTKEKQIPMLRCQTRDCTGAIWLEPKKTEKAGTNKTAGK